jgi:hypothetical protein
MSDGWSAGSSEARKSGGGERVARRAREDGLLERVLQPGDRPFSDGIRGGARAALHGSVQSARSSVLDMSSQKKVTGEDGQVDARQTMDAGGSRRSSCSRGGCS